MAPEIEVSGLAVYAMEAALDVSECIMEYAILVAGAPQNVPWICKLKKKHPSNMRDVIDDAFPCFLMFSFLIFM